MAEFDPFDPAFIADPYPVYHRLRREDPVHRHPLGFYVLTRYDDVAALLRDERFGRGGYRALLAGRFGGDEEETGAAASMLFTDPPDHTRLRTLVSKAFTPRVVETMRPHIQALVDDLLDRAAARGGMDVIAELAYPLPVTVISELLGVPREDADRIKQWSGDLARALDAIATPVEPDVIVRGRQASRAIRHRFADLIAQRRGEPRADLLSALVAAEEAGDRLSEEELMATCVLLYVAGHETTVNLIGNGLLALLRHPAQWERVVADPSVVPAAVEELLRYDGPVHRVGRIATVDVELGGRLIPAGSLVVGLPGAANRDPAHFPDPDRLDVGRRPERHLAFGWGIHICLGAPLARLETQVALRSLAARWPRLALATDRPEWRAGITLRGLAALSVRF
jgi:pimeloyl-[acyl-carrier protein] synthase